MNAKKECIECESLNTFYYENAHICNDCGNKEIVIKIDIKKIRKLLSISFIVLTLITLTIWF